MHIFGHNPNGLTRQFMVNNPFRVAIKPVELKAEHKIHGVFRGETDKPKTIRFAGE